LSNLLLILQIKIYQKFDIFSKTSMSKNLFFAFRRKCLKV